jgi:hypothetical protein
MRCASCGSAPPNHHASEGNRWLIMNASVDPLSHTLGRIEQALETITKTLSEDRLASASYRTEVRRDLATVRDGMGTLKNEVANNADELAELRPFVEDYRLKAAQGAGILNAAKALWVILIGLGATGIGVIIHAFWPKQ